MEKYNFVTILIIIKTQSTKSKNKKLQLDEVQLEIQSKCNCETLEFLSSTKAIFRKLPYNLYAKYAEQILDAMIVS